VNRCARSSVERDGREEKERVVEAERRDYRVRFLGVFLPEEHDTADLDPMTSG
jgi:hypothetical protein